MNFRNMTFYRFPAAACAPAFQQLETYFAACAFREVGPLEMSTQGFVSPLTLNTGGAFTVQAGSLCIIAMAIDTKILPASVVQTEVAKLTKNIHDLEGRRVGARERKRLKEEALTVLLPRALSRRSLIMGMIDLADGWVVVGTASRRLADAFISQVRFALGHFPVVPISANESPRATMTDWVIRGQASAPWTMGDECVLRNPAASGSGWSGRRIDIDSDEVKEHLRAGFQVFRLGLELEERCGFVLDDSLCIRKFGLTNVALDERPESNFDTADEERAQRLTLDALEVRRVLNHIHATFGTPAPEVRE